VLWRQLARGLRTLTNRATVDDEIDEEVRDYYERARADLVTQGLSPEEAARVARRQLGDISRAREAVRSYGWENVAEAILIDLRHALRRLGQSPVFAAIAVGTLALGVGATTAIVSALWPILVEPLPYPQADRVVMLTDRTPDGAPMDTTYGTYMEVSARSRSFDGLAVAQRWQPVLAGSGESERLGGDRVTAGFFRVLGVSPAVGRDFEASDETVGGPQFVIVSDALAKRRFGSARAVLDQTIRLDGVPHTVVGVMPPGFENVLAPTAEVWSAMQFRARAPFQSGEWGHQLRMVGRLEPGVSIEQARDELAAIGASLVEEFPRPEWALMAQGLTVESLQRSVTTGARTVLLAVFGAVLLLLAIARIASMEDLVAASEADRRFVLQVIAIFAVAALVLAALGLYGVIAGNVAERTREIGLRSALGATRADILSLIVRQGMTLTALGVVIGLVGAVVATRGLTTLLYGVTALDPLTYVGVIFLLAGVSAAACWAPAWRAARIDPTVALRGE
jgi:hypothetical protein